MSVGNEEIFRAIGELSAKVERLIEDQRQADHKSEASRQRIYEMQTDHAIKLAAVELRATSLEAKIDPLQALADKADEWENRGKGALAAAGMIGGGIAAGLIYFKDRLLAFFFGH